MFFRISLGWTLCFLTFGIQACVRTKTRPSTAGQKQLRTQRLSGSPVRWSSQIENHKALLVFMTIWCESCKKELPHVFKWAQRHRDVKLFFVVSGSSKELVQKMVKQQNIPRAQERVILDTKGKLAQHYRIEATPTLIYLDPKGQEKRRVHKLRE